MDKKGPADGKRLKISKAQQYTILEVLGASLVLGACVVLATFLIKYIDFNTLIISEKNEAIAEYDETLRNVGVCVDQNRDGELSSDELEQCDPNSTRLAEVSGSLRYNVLVTMAENDNLESVARQRSENCYDEFGNRLDFDQLYEQSTDELEKQRYLQSAKICSALRVVPDALPAQKNTEALMASLNQIFILTGWDPDRLAPLDDTVVPEVDGVEAIPVQLRIDGPSETVMTALNNVERSIREFDITSATVEWTSAGLSLQANANAFYLATDTMGLERTETLYATDK